MSNKKQIPNMLRKAGYPVLAVMVAVGLYFVEGQQSSTLQQPSTGVATSSVSNTDSNGIEQAIAQQQSRVWVEASGRVSRLLADDLEGSRHQKFILKLASGHTVLVSHNIDLATRVPVERNALIRLRGRFEWSDRGGVLHWTHHDPDGRMPGGWIEVGGKRYK